MLLQSGLDENWWADSMECYTYLRNIQDLLSDGKNYIRETFWETFKGPIVPFGSLVEYYPISGKDQSRIHQFGLHLKGVFLQTIRVANNSCFSLNCSTVSQCPDISVPEP